MSHHQLGPAAPPHSPHHQPFIEDFERKIQTLDLSASIHDLLLRRLTDHRS